jgi:hypothetical protein
VRRIRAITNLPKGVDGGIAAKTAPLMVGAGLKVWWPVTPPGGAR